MNNFNSLAPIYDALAYLVFGKAIYEAASAHLGIIKKDSRVLVLGGGTGKVLEKIPKCGSIFYVDSSEKMVRRAKRRAVETPIEFLVADFMSLELSKEFDVIVCPFFLDCFNKENLQLVLQKAKSQLASKGDLIVVDFDHHKTRRWLERSMHFFFRITASLESKKLIDIKQALSLNGFSKVDSVEFDHGIFSARYVLEQ